jgi:hypothetical protein
MVNRQRKNKKDNVLRFDNHKVAYFSWFTREGWDRLAAVSTDANFDEPYDQWLASAQYGVSYFQSQGFIVKITDIDVTELLNWCNKHSRPFNSRSLSSFLSDKDKE